MNSPLFIPMFFHVCLTALLYVLLTIMRAPSVWNIGARKDGTNPFIEIEKRCSANLSNQFEWPLFFHIACVILFWNEPAYTEVYLYLAWGFIIGRVIHSYVHIFTANIRLRGIVFTINLLAVFGMWIMLFLQHMYY